MKKVVLAVLIALCGVSLSFGGKTHYNGRTYSTDLEVEKCKEDNKCNDKETDEKNQCIENCHESAGGSVSAF